MSYLSIYQTSMRWWQQQRIEKVAKNLQKRFFKVHIANNAHIAREIITESVSPGEVVAKGDSLTLEQIGIVEHLKSRGNVFIDPYACHERVPDFDELRKALGVDVFITSVNAVSLEGEIIMVDGVGNRISATIFGPRKIFIILGQNKIVDTTEDGFRRVASFCAPLNRHRRGRTTPPCAQTAICCDCHSEDRSCRIYLTLKYRPRKSDIIVILVKEDLGM